MQLVLVEAEKRAAEVAAAPVVVTRTPIDKPVDIVEIARFADGMSEWEVSGGPIERLTERFDVTNHEALLYIHRVLERSGVLEQLRTHGVKYGDLVHVGELAFEFEE